MIVRYKVKLTSEYGIIDVHFRANDLEPNYGMIEFYFNKITNELGIRAAATAAAARDKDLREIEFRVIVMGNFHCHLKKSAEKKCCKDRLFFWQFY